MRLGVRSATIGCAVLLGAGLFARSASAQQANAVAASNGTALTTYDIRREAALQGTVVSFETNSTKAPKGAHVMVQTASGDVDVHLGDARLLASKNIFLNPGDAVRIIGENLPFGNGVQFFARVVQKGQQTVALRSVHGFPLKPLTKPAGGAL